MRNPFKSSGNIRPPVIVASVSTKIRPHALLDGQYPILEGRHRQPLPQVPGISEGLLIPGAPTNQGDRQSDKVVKAWLIPWRVGSENTMVITVVPGTVLIVDTRCWQTPNDSLETGQFGQSNDDILRRATRVLDAASRAFSTAPSIGAAYDKLEEIWNNEDLMDGDPQGDLLKRHARQLRADLEDLAGRPRSVLRTEHRMQKLQSVRRTDAKTLRWLSAQPGRNTAERAGARQRIRAPKRFETIETLENRVLRAFAALTVREAGAWLSRHNEVTYDRSIIVAHQLRAKRIEKLLMKRGVSEARPPVIPNFPLRFDPRYRNIWRAWLELRKLNSVTETEWMWRHRTLMELLGLRAAMKLQSAIRQCPDSGVLAHGPVIRPSVAPNQGRFIEDGGISGTFGVVKGETHQILEYQSGNGVDLLGSIADVGQGTEIFWDIEGNLPDERTGVGELPWTRTNAWEQPLEAWAKNVTSCSV